MTGTISENGLRLIESIEGFRATAYDDANPDRPLAAGDKVSGTLTQGYGTTGADVKIGTTWTQEEAEQHLKDGLQLVENTLNDQSVVKVSLTQNQFDALCSFVYNVGTGAFKDSTLLRLLNQGNYGSVPSQMNEWVHTSINGQEVVSPGLVARRAKEAALWSTHGDDEASQGNMSVTPVPVKKKTLLNSVTAYGVVLAGVPAVASQYTGPIQDAASQLGDFKDLSPYLHHLWAGLSLTGIGLGLYGKIRSIRNHGV